MSEPNEHSNRQNGGSATQNTPTLRDARTGVFFMHDIVIDEYGRELGPYGLAVYTYLVRRANKEARCWPSMQTIADDTGMSRDEVKRQIKHLAQLELLIKESGVRSGSGSRNQANSYVLLDPKPPELVGAHSTNGGCSQTLGARGVTAPRRNTQREGHSATNVAEPDGSPGASTPPPPEGHQEKPENHDAATAALAKPKDERTTSDYMAILCARMLEVNAEPDSKERTTLAGGLTNCRSRLEATPDEMMRVVSRLVSRWSDGARISPQRALGDIRGVPTTKADKEKARARERASDRDAIAHRDRNDNKMPAEGWE